MSLRPENDIAVELDPSRLSEFALRNPQIRKRVMNFSHRLRNELPASEQVLFVSEPKTFYVIVLGYLLFADIAGPYLWYWWWEPTWKYYWPVMNTLSVIAAIAFVFLAFWLYKRDGIYVTTRNRIIRYADPVRLKKMDEYLLDEDVSLLVCWDPKLDHDIHRYILALSNGQQVTIGSYFHEVYGEFKVVLST